MLSNIFNLVVEHPVISSVIGVGIVAVSAVAYILIRESETIYAEKNINNKSLEIKKIQKNDSAEIAEQPIVAQYTPRPPISNTVTTAVDQDIYSKMILHILYQLPVENGDLKYLMLAKKLVRIIRRMDQSNMYSADDIYDAYENKCNSIAYVLDKVLKRNPDYVSKIRPQLEELNGGALYPERLMWPDITEFVHINDWSSTKNKEYFLNILALNKSSYVYEMHSEFDTLYKANYALIHGINTEFVDEIKKQFILLNKTIKNTHQCNNNIAAEYQHICQLLYTVLEKSKVEKSRIFVGNTEDWQQYISKTRIDNINYQASICLQNIKLKIQKNKINIEPLVEHLATVSHKNTELDKARIRYYVANNLDNSVQIENNITREKIETKIKSVVHDWPEQCKPVFPLKTVTKNMGFIDFNFDHVLLSSLCEGNIYFSIFFNIFFQYMIVSTVNYEFIRGYYSVHGRQLKYEAWADKFCNLLLNIFKKTKNVVCNIMLGIKYMVLKDGATA